MGQTLTEIAKQAARLLLIELFVPGGTLIVISILLASRVPAISERFASLAPLLAVNRRHQRHHDLVAYYSAARNLYCAFARTASFAGKALTLATQGGQVLGPPSGPYREGRTAAPPRTLPRTVRS